MPAGPAGETLAELALVDGHAHTVLDGPVDVRSFELACTEADLPGPPGLSYLDGPTGLAVRRWCAPTLDLPMGAEMDEYLDRRAQLGTDEVAKRLLGSARLSDILIDTGLRGAGLAPPEALEAASGARVHEVVRLERVAEDLAGQVNPAGFGAAYREALAEATRSAVAVKSILAYRSGFAIDPDRPAPAEVRIAARQWLSRPGPPRLDDPVLLRFLLWCAVDRGLPLQVHAGFGDRDLYLPHADPAVFQPFLAATVSSGVPVVLLHCYPYHRQAGWLAQVYPHVYLDVGLTVTQVGARAEAVLAEFCELAPFGKLLFSTDGYQLPELYLVGAAQFRHSFGRLLDGWVADGAMPGADAARVARLVGVDNCRRLYNLPAAP